MGEGRDKLANQVVRLTAELAEARREPGQSERARLKELFKVVERRLMTGHDIRCKGRPTGGLGAACDCGQDALEQALSDVREARSQDGLMLDDA